MKKYLFLALVLCATCIAQAQISNSWTTTIRSRYLPTNAAIPTVAPLEETHPSKANFVLYLDATTYDNANDSTAFSLLGAAVKTAIDSNYVEEVFGLDPALDITMRTVITWINREWDAFDFNNKAAQYTADEDVFKVTGYCEWEIANE